MEQMNSKALSETNKTSKSLYIIGIGASAGGLEALRVLVAHLPLQSDMCYIIAQHLAPQHRTMLVEILARETELDIVEAKNNNKLKPNIIYITPPNKDIFINADRIRLRKPQTEVGPKPSVDYFFTSLANEAGERAVGIILSGTGSDGAHGIRAIQASGGLVIAQKPESAKYDSMPRAAIQAGATDLVLTPEEIAQRLPPLLEANRQPGSGKKAHSGETFEQLIELLRQRRQVDFSGYKKATLERQLERRLVALQIDDLQQYIAYINKHDEELDSLLNSFLISVTSFFRDSAHFAALKKALQEIIDRKSNGNTKIRIWVPGSATGEEPYSIAILLMELLGERLLQFDIKIFATDLDEKALERSRQGLYPETSVESIKPPLLTKYFAQRGRDYQISKRIRELTVFARHDLIQDPPFIKVDLVSCRNVLIYFNAELQQQVFSRFHYALLRGGFLFLGKSESVGNNNALFDAYDSRHRIYRAIPNLGSKPHLLHSRTQQELSNLKPSAQSSTQSGLDLVKEQLFKDYVPASVLVDKQFQCIYFFGNVSEYLLLRDGVANLNLLTILPNSLRSQFRVLLKRAAEQGESSEIFVKSDADNDNTLHLRISVRPAAFDGALNEGYLLVSFDKTSHSLHPESSGTSALSSSEPEQRILALEQELEATRENLQTMIEEMETTNEELMSLNEELQASTEELQSSNEELETTNEELQATNEELATVNEELRVKSGELIESNNSLENIQNSIDFGLIVVDLNLKIMRFTPKAVRIFGIIAGDIGQELISLRSHLTLPHLKEKITGVCQTGKPCREQVTGHEMSYLMQINSYLNETNTISGAVLTFTELAEPQRITDDLKLGSSALEDALDGVVISDVRENNYPIVYVSESFCKLSGYNREEILGHNCRFLQGADTNKETVVKIREALQQERPFLGEILNYRKNGSTFWNLLRLTPLINSEGELTHYVGILTDISERKRHEALVLRQANYDPLTGLPNRNLLINRLKRQLHLAGRRNETCYVLFIDLDGFKEINDTLGHNVGDELLVEAANRLQRCVRESDTVARFGGDEFVLILSDVDSLDGVVRVANSILEQLRQPFWLQSGSHRLSGSIGIAIYPDDGDDSESLIQHADTAMYRAKQAGRDTFEFFRNKMNIEVVERTRIKQAIFRGLERQEFELYYQPIFAIQSGAIVGAEALLRWHDPQQGLIPPDQFIPIAEETGQIVALGQWVIEQAIHQLHDWQQESDSQPFYISVNLSPRQMWEDTLYGIIEQLPVETLTGLAFEITESVFLEKQQHIFDTLKLIREKQGRINIDDFGMGYSSFKYLQDFPFDTIKIDKQFVNNSQHSPRNVALIEAILALAKALNAEVIAEGVETAEQLDLLKIKRCHYAQGFHLAKPMTAAGFERLLAVAPASVQQGKN